MFFETLKMSPTWKELFGITLQAFGTKSWSNSQNIPLCSHLKSAADIMKLLLTKTDITTDLENQKEKKKMKRKLSECEWWGLLRK